MRQTLKATLEDLPLISAYLHDARIGIDTIKHNSEQKTFSVEVKRDSYEHGKKEKKFWFIPIVKYPSIISLLTISKVENMEMDWFEDTFIDEPGYPHQILDINDEEDNKIELLSDYFKITLSHTSESQILLEDISELSDSHGSVDIGGEVFFGLEAIERLVVKNQDE